MQKSFGRLPDGREVSLYTIHDGAITAKISDLGATLVSLIVPDKRGHLADVVLGFDAPEQYVQTGTFFGAVVGRNANRIKRGSFYLNGKQVKLTANKGKNNLHSGPDYFKNRIWSVESYCENSICMRLDSPEGDQGFPGKASIYVTYTIEKGDTLRIVYDAISDKDTVFNFTNHSYFNMAGHNKPELGAQQILTMPARFYLEVDEELIPTGELKEVVGTPMDFREPKPICRDLGGLKGYDHTFEVFTAPCAILSDPQSGRIMAVTTDCPGMQVFTAPNLNVEGKDGVHYGGSSGVCFETQFYPDSVNHPQWKQPITKAGERYHSETSFRFH